MSQKLHEAFQSFQASVPRELEERVLRLLERERERQLRERRMWAGAGVVVSFLALVVALGLYGREVVTSDMWSLLTLLWSDAGVIAQFWGEFLLTLLEMLPLQALVYVLLPSFCLLLFLRMYAVGESNNFPARVHST